MQVVRALYDGCNIKPFEPVKSKKKTEVLVIFPDEPNNMEPSEARKLLRGAGKGEKLNQELLKHRAADLEHESKKR